MKLCVACNQKFERFVKIDGKRRNLTNRSKCLICQPFQSSIYRRKSAAERRTANALKVKRYYDNHKAKYGVDPILVRREWRKRFIIGMLGGACQHCGYSRCVRNLTFHHLSDKKFGISSREFQFAMMKVVPEIVKCALVCHNCHGEIHDGLIAESLIVEYNNIVRAKLSSLTGNWPVAQW